MSTPKFHALKIREIRRETADCVSVSFELPEAIQEAYRYEAGQHLTLRKDFAGEEVRRSYSICTAPSENDLRVAVKELAGGRFSTYVNRRLRVGDVLDVMTPSGKFYHPPVSLDAVRHVVAFAAGSGITPIISILKTVLENEPKSTFTLFYANKKPDSIIFLEEVEDLKNRFLHRLSVHHVMSRQESDSPLFSGRIDADKCRVFCKTLLDVAHTDDYYLCGPMAMVETLRQTLQEEGADPTKIHTELFFAPGDKVQAHKVSDEAAPSVEARIGITLDGRSFEFPLSSRGDTILDAALQAGANLPFACKGGVCCTCKARLTEGDVHMDVNYGLEPDELEAGFILTCQSHPLTPLVKVNFDV
jgi:ring-1,2-phenylacetyl-CoA epoxidase subunit PaaE